MGVKGRSSRRTRSRRAVPFTAGTTIKSVAADLGVNAETLRNWIRAADGRRPGSYSAARTAVPASDSAEVTALRRRVRELEEEPRRAG
ncbi:transposase [Streptomyces sp. NPDC057486]|uniref:transposase n=1 Tax=Streptomyces sp. NPDC057486 TaxID=3346145 RepID=UPI0036BFE0CE